MWTLLRRWFSSGGWFGDLGEREAARFLKRKKYRILGRQVRNIGGEIDLVAMDGETVVFVEVKTRRGAEQGAPFEAVNFDKQRRMTRAALVFLKQSRWLEKRSRFDVVSIVWPQGELHPEIQHFEHAFESTDRGQFYS
jgi:putative endonuclease